MSREELDALAGEYKSTRPSTATRKTWPKRSCPPSANRTDKKGVTRWVAR
jgi:hypothetical protein